VPLGVRGETASDDVGHVGVDQGPRDLGDGAGIALRRGGQDKLRSVEVGFADGLFL